MKKFLALFALTASFSTSYAQVDRQIGFKVGLNRSSIETDALPVGETRKPYTGFLIGVTAQWNFVERFGVRAEALYSRKGGKMSYEGPGFFNFKKEDGTRLLAQNGTTSLALNLNNTYLDVPILAVFRYGKLELSAGPSVSLLIGSTGVGELDFSRAAAPGGQTAIAFSEKRALSYNFFRDDAGEGVSETPNELTVDGQKVILDQQLGAYYQLETKPASLYNRLDLGLVGGLSFYFNDALYLGARLNYGLSDISNDAADLQLSALDASKKPVFLAKKDQNFVIQGCVGFSF